MSGVASRQLLGGLSAAAFLRKYWQKKPLLVRQAVSAFQGLLTRSELFALAGRDDVESRLVRRARGRWTLAQGPFRLSELRSLPSRDWTLLIQGVNLHVAAADDLLRRFAFLPYARLDDVMVSYAAPDAGDMLYLPPAYAHDGIAASECTTCSIGFRAPSAQELGTAFLDWLRDSIALEGRYTDASSRPTAEPARIGRAMQERCASMLAGVRWNDAAVGRFLGCYLSEPKPSVFFEPPLRPLAAAAFLSAAARRGVSLDRRTQLLYDKHHVFLNGTALDWAGHDTALIKRLANARQLDGARLALAGPIRTSARSEEH